MLGADNVSARETSLGAMFHTSGASHVFPALLLVFSFHKNKLRRSCLLTTNLPSFDGCIHRRTFGPKEDIQAGTYGRRC